MSNCQKNFFGKLKFLSVIIIFFKLQFSWFTSLHVLITCNKIHIVAQNIISILRTVYLCKFNKNFFESMCSSTTSKRTNCSKKYNETTL